MANPFEVQVVNPLQALLTGAQAYKTTNDASVANNKNAIIQSAAQDYQNGNQQGALAKLLGVGAYQEASAINNITGSAADRARQATQDQRQLSRDAVSDKFQAESLALQRRAAARADADKPIFKEVTDANGNTQIIRIMPQAGTASTVNTGIAPTAPANPFSNGGKFNGDQGKAAGFTDRMLQSEGILSGVGGQGGVQSQGSDVVQTGLSKLPGVGNYLISSDRQKFEQAKRDFINAQLRRESGAAVAPSEFASADKQYFPLPGDSPDVIKQKAANRRAAVEAMGREGGASYKPKYSFGPDGSVVPYGQPQQPSNVPQPGQLMQGYRFKGGDPGDQNNWVKAQ